MTPERERREVRRRRPEARATRRPRLGETRHPRDERRPGRRSLRGVQRPHHARRPLAEHHDRCARIESGKRRDSQRRSHLSPFVRVRRRDERPRRDGVGGGGVVAPRGESRRRGGTRRAVVPGGARLIHGVERGGEHRGRGDAANREFGGEFVGDVRRRRVNRAGDGAAAEEERGGGARGGGVGGGATRPRAELGCGVAQRLARVRAVERFERPTLQHPVARAAEGFAEGSIAP